MPSLKLAPTTAKTEHVLCKHSLQMYVTIFLVKRLNTVPMESMMGVCFSSVYQTSIGRPLVMHTALQFVSIWCYITSLDSLQLQRL